MSAHVICLLAFGRHSSRLQTIACIAVLRRLRHPAIVEFKGVGAMHTSSATAIRRSWFLVQV